MAANCVVTFASRNEVTTVLYVGSTHYLLQATPCFQPFYLSLRTCPTDVFRFNLDKSVGSAIFYGTLKRINLEFQRCGKRFVRHHNLQGQQLTYQIAQFLQRQ